MNFEGKKKVNVCASDFKALIDYNCYLVDKTFFIRHLLDECLPKQVFLFTRPRRFGKTLTLDMLKTFFDTENAQANRVLFQGMQIETAGAKYMAEQGQYPVISLSFADTKPIDYKDFRVEIATYLREVCSKFYYLSESEALTPGDKNLLKTWCDVNTPLSSYKRMLGVLSQWLQKAHPQHHPVILLIDEYDTPLQVAYENGYYDKAVNFFRDFLCNGLKINQHLKFAVLTGILRITKESIFSGLNNLVVDTVFNTQHPDVFGFTQAEINSIAEYYECQEQLDDLKRWYDGYVFGTDHIANGDYQPTAIYNPWSILMFLYTKGMLDKHWVNTAGNALVLKMCETLSATGYNKLIGLMNGQTIQTELTDTVTYGQIAGNDTAVFTFLTMAGYFNADCISNREGRKIYNLRMPNKEVNLVYGEEIINRWTRTFYVDSLRTMLDDIVDGNTSGFNDKLREFIFNTCSYYNGARSPEEEQTKSPGRQLSTRELNAKRAEDFYHGLMLGLTGGLTRYYTVESEKESGWGRADIMFIPRSDIPLNNTLPVIVMELKKSATKKALPQMANKALEQIRGNRYGEKEAAGRPLLRYGIAFYKKDAVIVAG